LISRVALSNSCSPAVLSRAAVVADRGLRIHDRTCSYEGELTILTASVDATYSYDAPYRASVRIDEEADRLVGYGCTCPAARKYAGPCKHAIALCLDFNDRSDRYEGFDEAHHVVTSRSIAHFLDRRRASGVAATAAGSEERQGSVRLVPQLVYDLGGFSVRFKIAGERGSYVLKSPGALVDALDACSYVRYGKKLAFTHDMEAFEKDARPMVRFVERAVRNRRTYALDRLVGRGYAGTYHASSRELRLSPPELEEFLDLLVGTEVSVEDASKGELLMPGATGPRTLSVERGDPEVSVELVEVQGGAYEFRRHGDARFVRAGSLSVAVDGEHLWICSERLAPVADLLAETFSDPSDHLLVSKGDVEAFAAAVLPKLESSVRTSVPERLEALRPQPLSLRFYLDYGQRGATCVPVACYGDKTYAVLGPRGAAERNLARDAAGEARAREVVLRYLPVTDGDKTATLPKSDSALATLVFEGTREMARLGEVMVTDGFRRLKSTAHPSVSVGVSMRNNLIDLTVTTSGIPAEDLHALLASYRLKRRYHRLRDGSILDLSTVDLDQISELTQELSLSPAELTAGEAEVPSYKAFLLEDLIDPEEQAESFRRYVEGFRAVDPTGFAPPASLAGVLRPYQVAGYQWLRALTEMGFGGILADEMGLGKSVQLISLVVSCIDQVRACGPVLVVCPASLVYNWQAEFAKFAPELDTLVVVGTAEARQELRRSRRPDVMVTSYDLLRRDVQDYAGMRLWAAVLDEAQYIKNHETLAARSVKHLRAEHRFALTGTPVENRLSELWSIFDFLMPGLLGTYERFRDRFERPIVEEGSEATSAHLRAAVGPFILRRLKRDVLTDLPDKLEQVVRTHMDDEQRKLYEALAQELRESIGRQSASEVGRSKMQILAGLMRLRQVCCDPRLVFDEYEGPSAKLEAIMEIVEQVVDARQKMLLFSQFTSYLDIIAQELDRRGVGYLTITGQTPKRRRIELVDKFNSDDTPVFLISLKAGGTGLNLTGANIVLHADPWWNAAAQNQATDRAHRIGQTKEVCVYKVICENTLEERILDMQEAKSALADEVVGQGAGSALGSLSREDLLELLE